MMRVFKLCALAILLTSPTFAGAEDVNPVCKAVQQQIADLNFEYQGTGWILKNAISNVRIEMASSMNDDDNRWMVMPITIGLFVLQGASRMNITFDLESGVSKHINFLAQPGELAFVRAHPQLSCK